MSVVNSFAFDFGRGQPARRLGIYFHGVNGTMYADYGMYKVVPEGPRMDGLKPPTVLIPPSPGHEREWLDSIKTRKSPSCSPDYHCKVDVPLVLANLSLKLGPGDSLRPGGREDRRRRGSRPAIAARVPRPWKFPAEYV